MSRLNYTSPPIREAVCEFVFEGGRPWDVTFPGRFYENIKADYPAPPTEEAVLEAEFGAAHGTQNVKVRQSPGKVQFSSLDGARMIKLGRNVLSVHRIGPYPGWLSFRSSIEGPLAAYVNLASPPRIRRLGIRYINRIEVPAGVQPRDLVRGLPEVVEGIPTPDEAYLVRRESWFRDRDAKLLLTLASIAIAPEGLSGILVDIDIIRDLQETSVQLAMSQVDDLKQKLNGSFEALITDEARRMFNATDS